MAFEDSDDHEFSEYQTGGELRSACVIISRNVPAASKKRVSNGLLLHYFILFVGNILLPVTVDDGGQ